MLVNHTSRQHDKNLICDLFQFVVFDSTQSKPFKISNLRVSEVEQETSLNAFRFFGVHSIWHQGEERFHRSRADAVCSIPLNLHSVRFQCLIVAKCAWLYSVMEFSSWFLTVFVTFIVVISLSLRAIRGGHVQDLDSDLRIFVVPSGRMPQAMSR